MGEIVTLHQWIKANENTYIYNPSYNRAYTYKHVPIYANQYSATSIIHIVVSLKDLKMYKHYIIVWWPGETMTLKGYEILAIKGYNI